MVSVNDVEKYCTYDTRVERAFREYVVGKVKATVSAGSVNTDVANGGNGE